MTKQERIQRVMEAIKSTGLEYRVLDESNGLWRHVRIVGMCDVWPSSGTYRAGNKYVKKSYSSLFKYLGSDASMDRKEKKEDRFIVIEERLAYIEDAICRLSKLLAL